MYFISLTKSSTNKWARILYGPLDGPFLISVTPSLSWIGKDPLLTFFNSTHIEGRPQIRFQTLLWSEPTLPDEPPKRFQKCSFFNNVVYFLSQRMAKIRGTFKVFIRFRSECLSTHQPLYSCSGLRDNLLPNGKLTRQKGQLHASG